MPKVSKQSLLVAASMAVIALLLASSSSRPTPPPKTAGAGSGSSVVGRALGFTTPGGGFVPPTRMSTGGGGGGDITDVVAGAGLINGGATGAVTLDIGTGTGITVGADSISVDLSTVADGDLGDVSVTSGVWSVDSGAVAYSELSGAFTTSNVIPKGNGTGLTASSWTDDGTTSATTGNLTSGNGAGDIFDHNGNIAKFGWSVDGATYINEQILGFEYGTDADATGYINYTGYAGGATRFRSLVVADGKNATVCTFTGSTKALNCVGDATLGDGPSRSHTVNGNLNLADSDADTYITLTNTSTGGRSFILGSGGNASGAPNTLSIYDQTGSTYRAKFGATTTTINSAVSDTLTVNGATTVSPSANSVGLYVHDVQTGQTANDIATIYGDYNGATFDTTGGAIFHYAVRGYAAGTRSAGASALTNTGVAGQATGGQTNYGVTGSASGAATTNIGVYASASGASNNYGVYTDAGENAFNVTSGNSTFFNSVTIQDDSQLGETSADAVGIGITPLATHAQMRFSQSLGNKIAVYPIDTSSMIGFGVQTNQLQYVVGSSSMFHSFGYGDSDAFTEAQRLDGDGQVWLGDTANTDAATSLTTLATIKYASNFTTDLSSHITLDVQNDETITGATISHDAYAARIQNTMDLPTTGSEAIGDTVNLYGARVTMNASRPSCEVCPATNVYGLRVDATAGSMANNSAGVGNIYGIYVDAPSNFSTGDNTENYALKLAGAGKLYVGGAATFASTLNGQGAVDFDSTLNVDGSANIEGATVVDDTLNVTGAVDFDSALNVDGVISDSNSALWLSDDVTIGADDSATTVINGGTITIGTALPTITIGGDANGVITFTNGPTGVNTYAGTHHEWQEEFGWALGSSLPSATYGAIYVISNTGTGNSLNLVTSTGRPGVVGLETGTTTTGNYQIKTSDEFVAFNKGNWTFEAVVGVPNLSDGTNTWQAIVGLFDTATINPTDGCYYLYDSQDVATNPNTGDTGGIAGDNWSIWCASNSTRTGYELDGTASEDSFTTVSSPVAAVTWSSDTNIYHLKIVMEGTSKARFYIDGVEVGRITTNIPNASTRMTGAGLAAFKSAGTTARELQADWMRLAVDLTSARSD